MMTVQVMLHVSESDQQVFEVRFDAVPREHERVTFNRGDQVISGVVDGVEHMEGPQGQFSARVHVHVD
jgi:hypothetical protein